MFCAVFFWLICLIYCLIYYVGNLYVLDCIFGLIYVIICDICVIYYIKNFLYVLRCFLANLYNNLSYILYRKLPVRFAYIIIIIYVIIYVIICVICVIYYIKNFLYVLRCFLANLYNNLSYILYRKLPVRFALLFWANLCNNLS